jgi:hypothetical protein
MKKQKKPWPLATKITIIASMVTIIGGGGLWGLYHSIFGQKTESKSHLLKEPGAVKLKIKVTDTDFIPLKSVAVNIDSDRVQSYYTNSDGYVDFPVSKESAQVSITMSKDGYESDTKSVTGIDENVIQKFVLKNLKKKR